VWVSCTAHAHAGTFTSLLACTCPAVLQQNIHPHLDTSVLVRDGERNWEERGRVRWGPLSERERDRGVGGGGTTCTDKEGREGSGDGERQADQAS
jgi:hypothetical protein